MAAANVSLKPLRVAFIGPMPAVYDAGVAGMAALMLREFSHHEPIDMECFFAGEQADLPEGVQGLKEIVFHIQGGRWRWGRWYSRNKMTAFISGQIYRAHIERQLSAILDQRHHLNPFDVIYQFGHVEVFGVPGRLLRSGVPLVIHPEVHVAGELRWWKREQSWAKPLESWQNRMMARLVMSFRALRQKHDIKKSSLIISPGKCFRDDIISDCEVAPETVIVIANSINFNVYRPLETPDRKSSRKLKILYISRLSVRKGLEMVVKLSHALESYPVAVTISIVGGTTLWSDYSELLKDLSSKTGEVLGGVDAHRMVEVYHAHDMLIQPSHYEPFGLAVGEALACGLPVVASTVVGAIDDVNPVAARTFANGNQQDFEYEVRRLLSELQNPNRMRELAKLARQEAIRCFSPADIASQIYAALQTVAAQGSNHPMGGETTLVAGEL